MSHLVKLTCEKLRTGKLKYFLTKQIVKLWNSLPVDVHKPGWLQRRVDKYTEDRANQWLTVMTARISGSMALHTSCQGT